MRSGDGRALCTDPTDLLGDAPARTVIPTRVVLLGNVGDAPDDVDTPFIALPGVVDVECVRDRDFDYLAVAAVGGDDVRPTDRLLEERLGPTWGLHLVDGNVALDDLVEVVGRQAEAYSG